MGSLTARAGSAPSTSTTGFPGAARPATAEVVRRDLVDRETVSGTLGYSETSSSWARRAGTVTAIASEGSIVRRGDVLYEVDDRPTLLLYGEIPLWRSLSEGAEGDDVRQLERNLVALGYGAGTIDHDGEFDDATRDAVEAWEDDLGLPEDGVVELGDVEFRGQARRVGAHSVTLGSEVAPGTEVFLTTTRTPVVTVDLDATLQHLVDEDDRVRVTLPDEQTTSGRVSDVGRVAQTDPAAEETGAASATIEVVIAIRHPRGRILDRAPVDVAIEKERARNALAAPIASLLALAEGGYAVEVVNGRSTRLVAIETGMFAGGWVEVRGEAIVPGTEVVVPG